MAKFNIAVYESRNTDVVIEAVSSEEAWEIAVNRYDNDELFYSQFNDADHVDIYVHHTPIEETPNE